MTPAPSLRLSKSPALVGRRLALFQLLDAHDAAAETGQDAWAFACELATLSGQGVHGTTLRVLVYQGLVEHRIETTSPSASRRTFTKSSNARFTQASCFMLTPTGVAKALALAAEHNPMPVQPGDPRTPHYEAATRTLFFAGLVVKRFQRPSEVQELILCAFEEENWPPHIDDPLPPALEVNPKKRLSDTVFRLNEHQNYRLIRFESDGTGKGVIWREIDVRST
jgi:hypothetical protein